MQIESSFDIAIQALSLSITTILNAKMSVPGSSSRPDQDKEVDIESQLSTMGSRNSTFHIASGHQQLGSVAERTHTDEPCSVSIPTSKDESAELEGSNTSEKRETTIHVEKTGSSESFPLRWWQRRPNLRWPTRLIAWSHLHYALTLGLFVGFVILLVRNMVEQYSPRREPNMPYNDTAPNVTQQSNNITISTNILQPVDVPPLLDASLGAANIYFGKLLSNTTSEEQTILVYNGPNGCICIRWKTGNSFRNNVQCELLVSLFSIQSANLLILAVYVQSDRL